MPKDVSPLFQRDPQLGAEIADDFGGTGQNASYLVDANNARFTEHYDRAQTLEFDAAATDALDAEAVAECADIPLEHLTSFSVRGPYVVFQFADDRGRAGKDILFLNDDGSLEAPEEDPSPERAHLVAQARAARKVSDARSEAEQIIEDARRDAEEIVRKAAEKANQEAGEEVVEVAKKAEKDPPKRAPSGAKRQRTGPTKTGGGDQSGESKPTGARSQPRSRAKSPQRSRSRAKGKK